MNRKSCLAVAVALLVVQMSQHAEARYCNSPSCRMCNSIFGPLPGYELTSDFRSIRITKQVKCSASAIILSTPIEAVDAMLAALNLTPDDLLYDIGCGDGRILIRAAELYGCRAVGIEIDPVNAAVAKRNVRDSGVAHLIKITVGDARNFNLTHATAVTLYLFPDLMEEIIPKLAATARIVSYQHRLPGRSCREIKGPNGSNIYVAVSPSPSHSSWW